MAVTNSINTKNEALTLFAGTGGINIGTDSAAKSITIGSTNSTTSFDLRCGTSGLNIGNDSIDKTITINNSGSFGPTVNLYSGTGNINIGNDGIAKAFTIATTTLNIKSGSSGINIGNDGIAKAITIGYSAATISIATGTGSINIGNDSIDKTTTLASSAPTASVVFNTGSTSGGGSFTYPFANITGTSATLIIGVYHIANNASLVTLTLPTTAAIGTLIRVGGVGSGGWKIAQSSGQSIKKTGSTTTTGATGYLASGGQYDSVDLICIVANTTWGILSSTGTLTFN